MKESDLLRKAEELINQDANSGNRILNSKTYILQAGES